MDGTLTHITIPTIGVRIRVAFIAGATVSARNSVGLSVSARICASVRVGVSIIGTVRIRVGMSAIVSDHIRVGIRASECFSASIRATLAIYNPILYYSTLTL